MKLNHKSIDVGSTEDLRVDLDGGDEHEDSLQEGERVKFGFPNDLQESLKGIVFLNGAS